MPKFSAQETPARLGGRPRDEAVRERILKAALELLEEKGFAHITCDGIAERAGASKATIYRWWQNKAAILVDGFVESVAPELPAPEVDTLEEYVRVKIEQFARVLMGRKGRILAAVLAAAQEDPDIEAALVSHWIRPRRAVSRKALERFQAEGQLAADADIDQVLDSMYGPLHFLLMARHGKPTAAYAESLATLLLNGLLPRASRTEPRP